MFMLFTTPAAPQGGLKEGADAVIGAIREGAQKSGADFSYLVKTARQESAFDPGAKASRSTATGLFQFVEQTWLKTLKEAGPRLGLGRFASAVIETKQGRFDVPDPVMRKEILKLRSDPQASSLMAGALARSNAESLTDALGRKPDAADLYIAHVLGAGGAAELIRNSIANPKTPASDLLPDAAKSNPALFFDPVSGKAKTVGDVKAELSNVQVKGIKGLSVIKSGNTMSDEPASAPLAFAHPDGPALFSLFRNVGNVSPLNSVVGALWTEPDNFSSEKPAYFPASGQGLPEVPSSTATQIPRSFASSNSGKVERSTRFGKPLDLTRYRKPEADDE